MTATGARSPAADDVLAAYRVRFEHELSKLWPEGGRLGLAVSGGPDSLALLLLANSTIAGRFEVATVDHGLRPESAAECEFVAEVCRERSIPCEVLKVSVDPGNLQSNARSARYRALAAWAAGRRLSALATAHHEDDQAETLIMRLNRGSGVSGLAGVRKRTTVPECDLVLIRPLLIFDRHVLEKVVKASGLVPVSDPSNDDERFDRVHIRKAMAESPWLDRAAIAWSAKLLAEADDALAWAERLEWTERAIVEEATIRYRPRAPDYLAFRIVERAIRSLGKAPRGHDVDRLIEGLRAGKGGNVAGVLATVEGEDWVFRPEPPRRSG